MIPTKIIVHASFTYASQNIGRREIRAWHTDPDKPGGPYADIGYHEVIRRNGIIEIGRKEHCQGAHCLGHNQDSLGICIVGGCGDDDEWCFNYTDICLSSLRDSIRYKMARYPGIQLGGHNDYDNRRQCPGFDVRHWFHTGDVINYTEGSV